MARGKATTLKTVDSEVSVIDLVYHIAGNGGQPLSEAQIGKVLFENESQIRAAMREAGLAYLKPLINKLAGITERPAEALVEAGKQAKANKA